MAVSESTGSVTDPRECGSGREFVRERLSESDAPLSPVELSEEYDCTSGYMRDILSDFAAEGVADRVTTGRYVLADDPDSGGVDDAGDATAGSLPVVSDGNMADLPSDDADTDGSDPMPTQDEYQRQYSTLEGDEADGSDSSDPVDSSENTSASGGSDGRESDADLEAAPAAPLPMDPVALGVVLTAAIGLWLLYRGAGASESPDASTGGDQAGDSDLPAGGLVA